MYLPDYSPKQAMKDLGLVLAHRVRSPSAPVPPALADAENALKFLTAEELLDVVVATLNSGYVRGVERPVSAVKDPLESTRGRLPAGRTLRDRQAD